MKVSLMEIMNQEIKMLLQIEIVFTNLVIEKKHT